MKLVTDHEVRMGRLSNWHKVPVSSPTYKYEKLQQAMNWCVSYSSSSMFYYQYATYPAWYFESKDDALLFTLKWGG